MERRGSEFDERGVDFGELGPSRQREFSLLRDEACDNGQGFLFSRPLDVAGTEAFFKETAKHAAAALAPPAL